MIGGIPVQRLEGKIIEDQPNGDRKEFTITGVVSEPAVYTWTDDLFSRRLTKITLEDATANPVVTVDGPVTIFAKKLNGEYGDLLWDELDEEERDSWRSDAAALLHDAKGLIQ